MELTAAINCIKRLYEAWRCRKIRGWEKIDGFLSPVEAYALYRYAASLPRGATVCEIGSYKGKSTVCLARGLSASGVSKLIAIDPFDCSGDHDSAITYAKEMENVSLLDQFKTNIRMMGVSDIVEIKAGRSQSFVTDVPPLDLLFIDGDHSIKGCMEDYELYSDKVKPSGYLMFHDYDPARKDLGPTYVLESRVYPSLKWQFIEKYGSLWVGKRL